MTDQAARRLVLHIGTEKTGTTSIQSALAGSRDDLARSGIVFPKCLGAFNHTKLVAASLDDGVVDNIKANILAAGRFTERQFRRKVRRRLQREVSRHSGWRVLLVSSELIHSRLITQSEIERLLAYFRPYVDDITIVLFLRRQDSLAMSRFSSALRAGYGSFNGIFSDIAEHYYLRSPPERLLDDLTHYYDYRNVIKRFTPLVGKSNIRVAVYSPAPQANIERFFALAGIPAGLIRSPESALNAALGVDAQYAMSRINSLRKPWRSDGLRDQAVKSIYEAIETELMGEPRRAPRCEAKAFVDRFAESNEWVRANFFPDSERLFDDDFLMYPDDVDYSDLDERLWEIGSEYLQRLDALESSRRRRWLPPFSLRAWRRA